MSFGNTTWEAFPLPNITSLYDVVEYANDTTGDLFSLSIIFSAWIVMFISFQRVGGENSFMASSFVASLLALMFRLAGLLGDVWLVMFFAMTGIGILISVLGRK